MRTATIALTAANTYRTFIAGIVLVVSATGLILIFGPDRGATTMQKVMNVFMGCFFLVFSLPKFLNLSAFAESFKRYDLISRRFAAYAWAFPFLELALAVGLLGVYLSGSMNNTNILNLIIALISAVGVISVFHALKQKQRLDCACLGTSFTVPLSKVTLVENGAMLIMSLGMLAMPHTQHMVMAMPGLAS